MNENRKFVGIKFYYENKYMAYGFLLTWMKIFNADIKRKWKYFHFNKNKNLKLLLQASSLFTLKMLHGL